MALNFRIFDYFDEVHLQEVWIFLFLLWITLLNEIENPICDLEWNNFVYESIIHGKETHMYHQNSSAF
jgi:hypothetical protein